MSQGSCKFLGPSQVMQVKWLLLIFKIIHMRTCALTYQIKGPKTVNEAKIRLFRKIAILQLEVS